MNSLADAASPYLRQHAEDPVDWRPWGEEAFAEARERDVPVLVSIGYAACHWCHVMQHESFQDPDTARVLNEGYVSVKVDREERPDVDAVYMAALQAMRGAGGWPLTAVADGRGRPFFTGTYFPPDDRHGIPSFRRVLAAVSEAWRNRREAILEDAERLEAHVREGMAAPPGAAEIDPAPGGGTPDPSDEALEGLRRRYDEANGGFGSEPKFPPHGVLRWLLMRDEPDAWRMAEGTLMAIGRGGITDPLAGGVSRYSVDAGWRVPHFEKMLYDNVQLLPRWAEAYRRSGEPAFLEFARSTARWLEREMLLPGGAFATALDADSEGEEGAFYAWSGTEFDAAVRGGGDGEGGAEGSAEDGVPDDEVAFARAAFDVGDVGPFEGRNVPRAARSPAELASRFGLDEEEAGRRLERIRRRLLAVRERRPRPARDEKVLTGQQGLAILGLARAGRLLNEPRMIELARGAAEWTLGTMVRDGRTYRRALGERVGILARLEDHALLGLGLLELHRADGDGRWPAHAAAQADAIEADFADAEGGGYLSAPPDEADPLPVRPRVLLDAAMPADTVAAAELLWRVARLTGDAGREARARAAVAPLAGVARRHPDAVGSALSLLEAMRATPREAAVTGPDDAGGTALWRELARRPLDAWTVQRGPAPEGRDWPLLEGRGDVSGRAAAWLCEAYACRLPLTDPAEVARVLDAGDLGA